MAGSGQAVASTTMMPKMMVIDAKSTVPAWNRCYVTPTFLTVTDAPAPCGPRRRLKKILAAVARGDGAAANGAPRWSHAQIAAKDRRVAADGDALAEHGRY